MRVDSADKPNTIQSVRPETATQQHNHIDLRLVDPSGTVRDISLSTPRIFECARIAGPVPPGTEKLLVATKDTLQMDELRCKTPAMVRKEITVHFIAYNLIRTVMAQAAFRAGISPRTISFKGTLQTLNAFRSKIGLVDDELLPSVFEALINAVAGHRVEHRPGRSEPRAVKRRPKSHPLLTIPRSQAA